MEFKSWSNAELDRHLKCRVKNERAVTAEIIEMIAEVERRQIHLAMGFGTLFTYCVEQLGYAAGSAQRRIDAARLLKNIPSVADDIAAGDLNLSHVSLIAQAVRQKEAEEPGHKVSVETKKALLEQVAKQSVSTSQKLIAETLDITPKERDRTRTQKDESVRLEITFSKEQFELLKRAREVASRMTKTAGWAELNALLASEFLKRRDPARDIRSRKSKADESSAGDHALDIAAKNTNVSASGLSDRVQNVGAMKAKAAVFAPGDPEQGIRTSKVEPSPDERARKPANSVSPSEEQSTNEPSGATTAEPREQREFHFQMETRQERAGPEVGADIKSGGPIRSREAWHLRPPPARRRKISAALRSRVLKRDHDCQFVDPVTGRRCGSRQHLDLDHIHPVWDGGIDDESNLRVMCAAHNRYRYRQQSGRTRH